LTTPDLAERHRESWIGPSPDELVPDLAPRDPPPDRAGWSDRGDRSTMSLDDELFAVALDLIEQIGELASRRGRTHALGHRHQII
jgi:hypothetical protein